jgi:uncharacterized protein YbaR (Trm112 family)
MQLPEWLLSTLACPRCKGPLSLPPLPPGEGQGEGIRTSSPTSEPANPNELHCFHCRLAYPIRGSVPELLQDEARPLESSAR